MKRQHNRSLEMPTGAKKRKFFLNSIKSLEKDRELSPVDSGFKEPSASTLSLPFATSRHGLSTDPRYQLPTDHLLAAELRRYYPNNPTVIERFSPKVMLHKIENKIVKSDLHKETPKLLLPKLPEITEIEFHGVILSKFNSTKIYKVCYYVRWLPFGILDDGYIICETTKATELKMKVKIDEMSYEQKKKVADAILRGALK